MGAGMIPRPHFALLPAKRLSRIGKGPSEGPEPAGEPTRCISTIGSGVQSLAWALEAA